MKILPLRLSLSKKSTLGGFVGSALFHAVLITSFINFYEELKPASEEKMTKISLNVFNSPIPLPPAAEPVTAPPAPPAPPPTEPVVVPEPIPIPEPVPEPIVKPEPKKEIKKLIEKPKPKPKKQTEKPVAKPEPIPEPTPAPPVAYPSPQIEADKTATISAAPSGNLSDSANTIAEFNFASSAGDERFSKIQQAIKKHQKYPKRAAKMKHQGVVEVSFLFKKNGEVDNVKVTKTSGYDSLDEAAMNTIIRAFKEFPLLEKDYLIKIPMSYKLI